MVKPAAGMGDIQYKHPHKTAGLFFGDSGEVVPIHEPYVGPVDQLLDELEDQGAVFPDRERAAEAVEAWSDGLGDARAAETISYILGRLTGRDARLRIALLGACGIAEAASVEGVARQTLWAAVKKLKAKILPPSTDGIPTDDTR